MAILRPISHKVVWFAPRQQEPPTSHP